MNPKEDHMGKDKYKSKSLMTRDELTTYLEALLAGLRHGTLILDNDERPLVLRPSDTIEAEVEIKQKGDKEKVELKLSWAPGPMQPMTQFAPTLGAPSLSADALDETAKKMILGNG